MRYRARRRTALAIAGAVVVIATAWFGTTRFTPSPHRADCWVTSALGHAYVLSPTQAQNASIISAVAFAKGLPDHAVTVALAAALQESKLINVDHGDLDSLGLFQQRPSQGWGTPAQIMDPAYAAGAFYDRLVGVAGWASLAVGDVAQAVQLSAAPYAYAPWESEARALARALTGEVPAGLSCRLSRWDGPVPQADALTSAARAEFGQAVIGQTLTAKAGWAVSAWAIAHAWRYHIARVGFLGRVWDSSAGAWRADPSVGQAVVVRS